MLRKLGKVVALFEKRLPDSAMTFYDLPTVMRREGNRRDNSVYNYRKDHRR